MRYRIIHRFLLLVMTITASLLAPAQAYKLKTLAPSRPDATMQKMNSIALNSKGYLYVLDKGTKSVHVFDTTGAQVELISSVQTNQGKTSFKNPLHLCIDPSDRLYIYDEGLGKIIVRPSRGNGFVFGEKGSAPGQIDDVRGLAVDSEGYIYILNGSAKQIDIFSSAGHYITWIKGGSNAFSNPAAIGINGRNELYVLEKEEPAVFIYDITGTLINTHRTFLRHPGIALSKTSGMAVMGNGDFFLYDAASQSISQFDKNAVLLGKLGTKGKSAAGIFENISAITASTGSNTGLAILDGAVHNTQVYNVETTSPQLTTASKRLQLIELTSARTPLIDIAAAPNGMRYALPARDRQMMIAYSDSSENEKFNVKGKFGEGAAIACDQSSNVYVVDRSNEEIIKFGPDGALISKFGKDLKTRLKDPVGIIIQSNGNIVVADHSNGNLHLWNAQGAYQKIISTADNSGISSPLRIQVDSKDQIYVWDEKENAIFRIASSGWPVSLKRLQVRPSSAGGRNGDIGGFFIDPLDQVHVLNKTTSQIEIYSWDLEPELKFSFGHPGGGLNGLKDTHSLLFDSKSFIVYSPQSSSATQKAFQFRFKPATPDNQYTYEINDGMMAVFFSRLPSRSVDSYGLIEVMPNGKDSLIATTSTSSFILPEEKSNDIRLHQYKIISISHGNYSDPTEGFYNYTSYADKLIVAGRYDDAIPAYEQAVSQMGKGNKMKEHLSKNLCTTGKALADKMEAIKALRFLRLGFALTPENQDTRSAYSMGYTAYFQQMANRDDYKGIVSEAERMMAGGSMKQVILQAVDSVSIHIARIPSETSINNAIMLQKKLISWDPLNPSFNGSLAASYFELYKFNRVSGVPVFELEAALKEAEKYASQSVAGLKKNKQVYFDTQLIHLSILNAAGRFSETETAAFNELNAGASGMSTKQAIQYRSRLAEAYAGQGKHELAILEYDRVLALEPNNVSVKNPMALSMIEAKKYDKAREVYQQLLLNDRDNAVYIARIGEIELKKGNFAEASFQLEKASKKDPADRSFYGPMAEAFQAASNYQKAIDNYEIAVQYEETKLQQARNGFASEKETQKIQETLNRYLANCAQLNNQIGNYEEAILNYKKLAANNPNNADAHYGLGSTCLSAGHIYDAVNALSVACRLNPSNIVFENAKNDALKARDRMSKDQASLTIQDIYIRDVYPSLYRNYADVRLLSLGEVVVSNNTSQTITPTAIKVFVKDIMDQPTEIKSSAMVAYSDTYIPLSAIFRDNILRYTGDEKLQVEITVEYNQAGKVKTVSKAAPFVVHGRNALTWSDKRCLGAFISPAVDVLIDYNKKADHIFRDQQTYGLNKNMLKALQVFTLLKNSQIIYSPDPSQNYALVSTNTDMQDYLQYPAETLKRKSGDCDDLVALFASLLENAGITTAYVDVPGHVFLAFDSEIKPSNIVSSGLSELDVIIANDKVWIPLETTMVSSHSFITAWKTAADRYYKELTSGHFPELVSLADARNVYVPSNYLPEGFSENPPSGKEVTQDYGTAILQLLAKTKKEVITEMENRYLTETNNVYVKNKYASLLAQIGNHQKAEKVFIEALELAPANAVVLNNLGNLYLLHGDAKKAIENYDKASRSDPYDGEILINLSKAYLLDGDRPQAKSAFDKAVTLNSELEMLYSNLKNQIK